MSADARLATRPADSPATGSPPRPIATPTGRPVALPGGLTLHVLQWAAASPTARDVVLVHGLADNAWVWAGLAGELAHDANVWAVELRGHGRSDRASTAHYTVAAMANDLRELVDTLGLPRPLLVGHSLGAAVALRAAAAEPTRFAGVALLDYATEIPPANLKLVRTVLAMMQATYAAIDDYAAILQRRHLLAAAPLLRQVAEGALQRCEGGFRPRFDAAVLQAMAEGDALASADLLPRLTLPVLVARGALSWMVPMDSAQRIAAACPQAELATVPLAGHSVQIDNPPGTLNALRAWPGFGAG